MMTLRTVSALAVVGLLIACGDPNPSANPADVERGPTESTRDEDTTEATDPRDETPTEEGEVDCVVDCNVQSRNAYDACIADGGAKEDCQQEALDVVEECLKDCPDW